MVRFDSSHNYEKLITYLNGRYDGTCMLENVSFGTHDLEGKKNTVYLRVVYFNFTLQTCGLKSGIMAIAIAPSRMILSC